jgi:hypothetical protein
MFDLVWQCPTEVRDGHDGLVRGGEKLSCAKKASVISRGPTLRLRFASGKLGRPWGMGHAIACVDFDISNFDGSCCHDESALRSSSVIRPTNAPVLQKS